METHTNTLKSEVTPMHAINTSASGGNVPRILNLGTTWWLSNQLQALNALSNGKSPLVLV